MKSNQVFVVCFLLMGVCAPIFAHSYTGYSCYSSMAGYSGLMEQAVAQGNHRDYRYLDELRKTEPKLVGKRVLFDLQPRSERVEALLDWKSTDLGSISGTVVSFRADGVNVIYEILTDGSQKVVKIIFARVEKESEIYFARFVQE